MKGNRKDEGEMKDLNSFDSDPYARYERRRVTPFSYSVILVYTKVI